MILWASLQCLLIVCFVPGIIGVKHLSCISFHLCVHVYVYIALYE
jgi:hypothetical protein